MLVSDYVYTIFCKLYGVYDRYVNKNCRRIEYDLLSKDDSAEKFSSVIYYAGTIGELQAVLPLISVVREKHPELRVVIVAGHSQYVESFRAICPFALVCVLFESDIDSVVAFFKKMPPRLVVISEGPSLYSRFPIRMSLVLPFACLKHDVPIVVTNACLYELCLGSRVDKIENILFAGMHKRSIKHWYVASHTQMECLIANGVPKLSVTIIGDLKFDNLDQLKRRPVPSRVSTMLAQLSKSQLVVGASLNNAEEEEALLVGWMKLRKVLPNARLVLAPRYINEDKVIGRICSMLEREDVNYSKRSSMDDSAFNGDVLLLDVFGELAHLYSIADVCFMGRDHGVLEPLAFSKPMIAGNRATWQEFNTSYPLYREMIRTNALVELENLESMGEVLIRMITDKNYRLAYVNRAEEVVAQNRGAGSRLYDQVSMYFD